MIRGVRITLLHGPDGLYMGICKNEGVYVISRRFQVALPGSTVQTGPVMGE